jgi:hypothetical protein
VWGTDDLESQFAKIGVDLKSRHPTLGKPADQLQVLIQKRLDSSFLMLYIFLLNAVTYVSKDVIMM